MSDYAYEAICWCTEKRIINGKNEKRLDPKGLATRAEVATILQRLANLMK